MSSKDQDSGDEAQVEISMKKGKNMSKLKPIVKQRITKRPKANNKERQQRKKKLISSLKQKFEHDKITQELKDVPLNFGVKKAEPIKIVQKKSESKKIKDLGIQLVHQVKRHTRRPTNNIRPLLDKTSHLRGSFSRIQALKKAK